MEPFKFTCAGERPEDLSVRLFEGSLILFRGLDSVAQLNTHIKRIVEVEFDTSDPTRAEADLPAGEFRRRSVSARRRVADDDTANRLWHHALTETGYLSSECYCDRLRLRIVPSRQEIHGKVIRPLPAHRDTWGSGIDAQINWWLPLYPLADTRTMIVWPQAFRQPLPNDSATWDYDALISGRHADYPMLPSTRTPDTPGRPIVIEPGELLAFSAAHLHAGLSDRSGVSRFSLDTRTVWTGDIDAGRGAPNVDAAGQTQHWEWFTPPTEPSRTPGNPGASQLSEGISQ